MFYNYKILGFVYTDWNMERSRQSFWKINRLQIMWWLQRIKIEKDQGKIELLFNVQRGIRYFNEIV